MRTWVIVAMLAVASNAYASEEEPPLDLEGPMSDYFDGEVTGGWILMGMGAAGLGTGGYLFADGGDRARGASYVTLGFGTAHLAAGIYVNVASRIRKRAYRVAIAKSPEPWLVLEQKRMAGVSTQFLVLKIVEVVLIAGGGTMVAIGRSGEHPRLEGAGYALAAEAAATLLFDIVASRRASRYRTRLRQEAREDVGASYPSLSFARDVTGAPVLVVGRAFSF